MSDILRNNMSDKLLRITRPLIRGQGLLNQLTNNPSVANIFCFGFVSAQTQFKLILITSH